MPSLLHHNRYNPDPLALRTQRLDNDEILEDLIPKGRVSMKYHKVARLSMT